MPLRVVLSCEFLLEADGNVSEDERKTALNGYVSPCLLGGEVTDILSVFIQAEDDGAVIDLEKHLGQVERPFRENVTRYETQVRGEITDFNHQEIIFFPFPFRFINRSLISDQYKVLFQC